MSIDFPGPAMRLDASSYLRLSAPFILASVTTPLLGAVGTAVVGHLGRVDYIGAVALGSVIFNTVYWLFNFLRLITSSYSSQALGRADQMETNLSLLRPGGLALIGGMAIILVSPLIFKASMLILSPEYELQGLIKKFFYIQIWGAPLVLGNFVVTGWLMGQMRFKMVMLLQVGVNTGNCLLCGLLVLVFNLNVAGVALAALISQAAGFGLSLRLALKLVKINWPAERGLIFQKRAFKDLWSTNFYLLIRTACMLVMVNLFMARSAAFGGSTLAANAILFQLQYILGDFFDGLANASSVYSGLAVGRRDRTLFYQNLKTSAYCGLALALVLTCLWLVGDRLILGMFTDLEEVLAEAGHYSFYLIFFPVLAFPGIVYYGIFNGALKTRLVCWSMLLTLALYLSADRLLVPAFGNCGLWLSFLIFYLGRSGFLIMFVPGLLRKLGFASNGTPP